MCSSHTYGNVLLQVGRSSTVREMVSDEPELQPDLATVLGDPSSENLTFAGPGLVQESDELMRFAPTADELKHFDLVKAERQRGWTCPDGTYFPPNQGEFKWDCRLAQAARKWSARMASENFIAHRKGDSTSCTRTEAEGFPKDKGCGENIAGGDSSPQGAINQLKKSNNHCINMFEPKFNKLGVGFASNPSSQYRHYWTDSFGEFPRGPDESCIGGYPAPTPAPGCADQDINCGYYKDQGMCTVSPNVKAQCRDTCGIDNCGYGAPSPVPAPVSPPRRRTYSAPPRRRASSGCADQPGQSCAHYKTKGYCSYDHIKEACAKTCGVCSSGATPSRRRAAPPRRRAAPPRRRRASSGCTDQPGQACAHYKTVGYCSYDHIKEACAKTCGVCSSGAAPSRRRAAPPRRRRASSGCADQPGQACAHYKTKGYCSYDHIKEACASTCGVCRR